MKRGRLRRLLGMVSVILLLLCLLSGAWIAALATDPSAVVAYRIVRVVATIMFLLGLGCALVSLFMPRKAGPEDNSDQPRP
jgi:hypothetical protein